MGTRRSRHNKGRKPLYKEKRRNLVCLRDDMGEYNIDSVEARSAFYEKQNGKCHYCNTTMGKSHNSLNRVTVSLKIPEITGGTYEESNLVAACLRCHDERGELGYEEYLILHDKLRETEKAAQQEREASLRETYSARSKAMMADPAMKARLSELQKARWKLRKANYAAEQQQVKEETIEEILALPAQWLGQNRGFDWRPQDEYRLKVLCESGVPYERAASILGRPETNIIHRARDSGIIIPKPWELEAFPPKQAAITHASTKSLLKAAVIAERERLKKMQADEYEAWRIIKLAELDKIAADKKKERARKRAAMRMPRESLYFPYISQPRPEHADLMRANDLVPRGLPEWIRADICQAIMLAIFEGTVWLDELERNKNDVKWFIRKFYREQMPREEVSISSYDSDDSRSYDEIASALSPDDWVYDQMNEKRSLYGALSSTHTPATQIETVYNGEIARYREKAWAEGDRMSFAEATRLVEGR